MQYYLNKCQIPYACTPPYQVYPQFFATSAYIENYALNNSGGILSIFDDRYASSIAPNYFHLYSNMMEGIYEALDHAERVTEELREAEINRLLGEVSEESLILQQFHDSQTLEQFNLAYDVFDPLLSLNDQVSEYEAKIRKSIQYFRWYGNDQAEEFADYLESLLPLSNDFSQEDYYSLYKTIRVQTKSLIWDYLRSIVGVTIESFKPVIELALWEVGGGLALKILSKLPVRYLTTPIKNVITRLKAPTSTAFSKLKHAKKYGIQSYKNLKATFDDLGLSLSTELVERHHLIEKRFINQMKDKLGSNTDDWLCIIVEKTNKLTASEHYKFTQEWLKAIGKDGGAVGWTNKTTSTATFDDIIRAVREIYKEYPEILNALGI